MTGKNYDRKKRYNTVIWSSVVSKYEHHQSHFNLRKFLLGFFVFTETLRSKLSITVYFFLALYGFTTIQSWLFLKNIENFVWFPTKQYSLGFFLLEKQLANIPDRGFLFLCNTLFLYSLSPYSRTERHTETQIHSLRVGLRNLFSSCAVVSCQAVFGSGGK